MQCLGHNYSKKNVVNLKFKFKEAYCALPGNGTARSSRYALENDLF